MGGCCENETNRNLEESKEIKIAYQITTEGDLVENAESPEKDAHLKSTSEESEFLEKVKDIKSENNLPNQEYRDLHPYEYSSNPSDEVKRELREKKDTEKNEIFCGFFDIENNQKNGNGLMIWPDGSIYEGIWKNDQRSGKGRLIKENGDVYEGEWQNDKAHGEGKYTYKDGTVYIGSWKDDKKSGHGIETYTNGKKYEGDFYEGNMQGKGKYESPGDFIYEGNFVNNMFEGYGEKEDLTQKRLYKGNFMNGKRHGRDAGVEIWLAFTKRFEGEFLDDKKHGKGIMYYEDGTTYEGHWQNNYLHGTSFINKKGKIKECSFDHGKKYKTSK